jgi:RsmE family RNA methyltransferase
MNLIILTEADRTGDGEFTLSDHRAIHIRKVLRGAAGETVEVGLLNGPVGTASIAEISSQKVVLKIAEWRAMPGLGYRVDLICAIPRPKTLKKVLTVSAMMGVRAVHFVRANRTDKSYVTSSFLHQPDCLPYLYDGLSQGKFTQLPEIAVHPLFRPFVEDELPILYPTETGSCKLICELSTTPRLGETLAQDSSTRFVIVIGPEGGWVPFETELILKAGFRPFCLGPWMLRVETAVTAALAQLDLVVSSRRR